jgi:hypothetical protein
MEGENGNAPRVLARKSRKLFKQSNPPFPAREPRSPPESLSPVLLRARQRGGWLPGLPACSPAGGGFPGFGAGEGLLPGFEAGPAHGAAPHRLALAGFISPPLF